MSDTTLHLIAFAVLIAAFVWGSVTVVNAGLIALVAAFVVGTRLGDLKGAQSKVADLAMKDVIQQFPSDLFFILAGATLLFSIVRVTGTIDLLAKWAERAAAGRRLLVPVLMFLLTAVLCTAGAFTPAAVAIVAPVAFALAERYKISRLAMGLAIIQGANAGAFSPVNPFGVVSNAILLKANQPGHALALYLNCFVFNAVLGLIGFTVVQWWLGKYEHGPAADGADAAAGDGVVAAAERLRPAGQDDADPLLQARGGNGAAGGAGATAVAAAPVTTSATTAPAPVGLATPRLAEEADEGAEPLRLTPMRAFTLAGLVALLVLTLGFKVDVGVAALSIALVLIAVRPTVQKPAFNLMPWTAIVLVTGIVTYVNVLSKLGSIKFLEGQIATLGGGSIAALITSYLVGVVSAFASTTGTLGAVSPIVVPLAASAALPAIGVVSAISVSSSVVDVSPMSTTGALLMANAQGPQERAFFRALLLWAILMIGVVPAAAWLVFVKLGWG
jgi:di/tricarboxylate transporter